MAASLSAAHIRLAIGLIAALFVLRHWLAARFERWMPKPSVATGIVFGAIGGITTMLANAGGPAWQMHLLPQKIDKLTYVGTVDASCSRSSNVVKVPGFATLGYLTRENLLVGLALVPIAVAANYRGHLAGAAHLERAVLPHRLCADVLHRDRADPQLGRRAVVALIRHDPCAKSGGADRRARLRSNRPPCMTIITDPLFYLFAVPAVMCARPVKGGFSGIGMVATPLLALILPPLRRPRSCCRSSVCRTRCRCWVYRRDWDPWNLKVMIPGA